MKTQTTSNKHKQHQNMETNKTAHGTQQIQTTENKQTQTMNTTKTNK